jgi:hypothetical protein
MSGSDGSPRRYVRPGWPQDEPFILEMLGAGGGHVLGPFEARQWHRDPDGAWWGVSQIGEKPIGLRVRSQEQIQDGPLILHANDGSIGDMDYAVWTKSSWQEAHPGEDWPG